MPTVVVPELWTGPVAAGPIADNWLATFQDSQLSQAVAEAILHNADLRVGAARVEQALLYAKLAGAKLYPSVDLIARGGGKLSGDGSGLQGGVLTVNWELDLWGRVRYGRAAASADAASAVADQEFARQSIAALVARSWFLATEAALQAEVARGAIREGEELVRLAETRSRVGVGNDEDVFVARANVGGYRDSLQQIELSRVQSIRALEILLGRYPAAAAEIAPQLPAQPGVVPVGLPSELLERRPDVIAAERRVAAAFNRVGEAKAARLPAIALTTGVSSISSELFVLQDRENPLWNFGANLLVPIFRGGALKTQVEIRTAEQKVAVASYATVGLKAFSEVENALAAEFSAKRARADPRPDARGQPAGAGDREDAVHGGEHRPALRHPAPARVERDAVLADPRAGRAARAAREPPSRAGRKLRAETVARSRGEGSEVTGQDQHGDTKTRRSHGEFVAGSKASGCLVEWCCHPVSRPLGRAARGTRAGDSKPPDTNQPASVRPSCLRVFVLNPFSP